MKAPIVWLHQLARNSWRLSQERLGLLNGCPHQAMAAAQEQNNILKKWYSLDYTFIRKEQISSRSARRYTFDRKGLPCS